MNEPRTSAIRAWMYSQPWLIRDLPELDALCERIESNGAAPSQIGEGTYHFASARKPGQADPFSEIRTLSNGVATINVNGPLLRRPSWITRELELLTLDEIEAALTASLADKQVNAIILRLDTPGGAVPGAFELASYIRKESESNPKPIMALADTQAASLGYLLASQCTECWATSAADVGSIGVIARIVDADRLYKNMGVEQTIIRSRDLKAPGQPPLNDARAAELKRHVMQLDGMFRAAIASARPGVDIEAAATGQTFQPAEAAELGLIDGITTHRELLARLTA